MAPILKTLALAGLFSTVLAAPAPAPGRVPKAAVKPRQAGGNPAVPTALPYGPPGSSGSLRGSIDLAGPGPASNQISSPDTDIPSNQYQLAPGQTADSDLGLYLDLSNVENPQPIRGPPGNIPTDPGPSELLAEKTITPEVNLLIMHRKHPPR